MATIFVSYNRHSEKVVRALVNDVEELGHQVWFDQELTGGQTWWDQILSRIRSCDLFMFVLDPASLESTACTREYTYAAQLGKTILPVLVADGVPVNLLPDELSRVQFIDVRTADRAAALRLGRALTGIVPAGPLPVPLPPPPEVPLSYLASVGRLVDSNGVLTFEQQSAILVDLRKALRDESTARDARVLMERFRRRRDLLASIADEMQEIRSQPPPVPVPAPPPVTAPSMPPSTTGRGAPEPVHTVRVATPSTQHAAESPGAETKKVAALVQPSPSEHHPTVRLFRARTALIAGAVGSIIGVAVMGSYLPYESMSFGLLTGAGAAIAGALAGSRRRTMIMATICAVIAWFGSVVMLQTYAAVNDEAIAIGGVFFAPLGCVLGAVGHLVWLRIRRRSTA